MDAYSREEFKRILFDFVRRVAEGEATRPAEVEALPEVAKILREFL